MEHLVSSQLLLGLEHAPLQAPGIRAIHSTETELLSLLSDFATDKTHVTYLVIFDTSSAFDMVEHDILLPS